MSGTGKDRQCAEYTVKVRDYTGDPMPGTRTYCKFTVVIGYTATDPGLMATVALKDPDTGKTYDAVRREFGWGRPETILEMVMDLAACLPEEP